MDKLGALGALGVFVRAAETLSFTEAGRQLGLSSSAIGKAVSRLEERLGVRLFNRNTRSVTLTQDGSVFLESCRRIFAEIEAVETGFAQNKSSPQGKLRVSLPMVGMLMMPIISRFMGAYPSIELDLDFTDHLVDVIDGGYDVVVRTGEADDSRLMARKLGAYRLQIVGSPTYLARAGIPAAPGDLASHACLHHRYPTNGRLQRWPFVKETSGAEPAIPVTASVSTVEPLISLALDGHGLACVPDFAIRPYLSNGALVVVLDEYVQHSGAFRAVWPTSRYLSPKVRAFVDFLVEHLFETETAAGHAIGSSEP